jgi:hypothetical protein
VHCPAGDVWARFDAGRVSGRDADEPASRWFVRELVRALDDSGRPEFLYLIWGVTEQVSVDLGIVLADAGRWLI